MKIGLQTWGSHGDIRPFVALATGLQAAGHQVTLVLTCVDSHRYEALRDQVAFDLRVVASPVVDDEQTLQVVGERIVAERDGIRQTRLVIEHFLLPAEARMYEASEQLCLESDLVIGHYFLYTLGVAAEKHGCPYVSVVLAPGAIPSAFVPPNGVPDLGSLGNRLTWRLGRWVLNRTLKRYPDRLRAAHGLGPARDMIDTVWASERLTLLAFSPLLCERRADWPSHLQHCGALDTPDSVLDGSVEESLRAFLSAGPAPVYMSLGSMMSGSGERQTMALLVQAAQLASCRAVIQAPHWESLGFACSEQIQFVTAAPHAAVFPLCSGVLHHGGAGTLQAALRAGRPSVVVPFTAEQELWAKELLRQGVAGPPVPRREATPERLAAAIQGMLRDESQAERARTLGARLAKEDGVATALRLIGQFQPA